LLQRADNDRRVNSWAATEGKGKEVKEGRPKGSSRFEEDGEASALAEAGVAALAQAERDDEESRLREAQEGEEEESEDEEVECGVRLSPRVKV